MTEQNAGQYSYQGPGQGPAHNPPQGPGASPIRAAGAAAPGPDGAPGQPWPSTAQPGPPQPGPPQSGSLQPGPRRPRGRGSLTVRPQGLWLVTSLELRQRLRSKFWYIALAVWTVVLIGIGVLGLLPTVVLGGGTDMAPIAAVIFSLQMILVLFAMLLVVPALSAGSINGDRTAGTLATLQASLLSPTEIVLGKILAGWLTGLAFLILALPSAVPTALLGGIGPLYALRGVVVIVLLTMCVTAVGVGLSALTNRQLGSVVLAYVLVFGVTVVGPMIWGFTAAFLQQERDVTVYRTSYSESSYGECEAREESDYTVYRLDLSQPLLWANPVVLLAEAAPGVDPETFWYSGTDDGPEVDLLRIIQAGLRSTSNPTHPASFNGCSPSDEGYPEDLGEVPNRPIWPQGMAMWVLAGGGSTAFAIWRISVPIRTLGKGTRIA